MKTLTVITTTYNRANCLDKLYNSLLDQECKDFVWLVIDDGSTDDTKTKIEEWKKDDLIEIQYAYKENGGMHTARNLGYKMVNTELNTIIDSDDWMAPDAVRKIIDFWNKNKDDKYAGIITLNRDPSGDVIGTDLPDNLKSCSYKDFWKKYHMQGDKKLVYRSELTKLYPYPEFDGEKFYPAASKFYQIDGTYDMLIANITTCIVDYNEDSMTRNKYAQYKNCPKSFLHYRRLMMNYNLGVIDNIKNMILYIMALCVAKERVDRTIPNKKLFCLCYLPGKVFYHYIMNTNKKY